MTYQLPAGVKVYTAADHPLIAHGDDLRLLDIGYRNQVGAYIVARTKAAAASRLSDLGYDSYKARDLRIASGTEMDALVRAGVIADDGALIITGSVSVAHPNVVSVSIDDVGHRYARLVGKFKYVPAHTEFERITF